MPAYNMVILVGNITRESEMKALPSGTMVVNTGICANRRYKDKDDPMFIDITVFGKSAEIFNQYVKKGDPILIEGRLRLEQWEHEGQKRQKHTVTVNRFQMLGRKPSESKDDAGDETEGKNGDTPF